MKKTYTLFLAISLALGAQAQEAATAVPAAPEILVLKEAEFNFGKIPQGKPVHHIFEMVNTGKDSLRIVNIQASCGCTTPEWDRDKAIAPGASTKVTVGFNAASEGPFAKPVTITYNGSQTKQLFIKGEVWRTPPTSAPENKSLGDLKN